MEEGGRVEGGGRIRGGEVGGGREGRVGGGGGGRFFICQDFERGFLNDFRIFYDVFF